MYTQLGVMTKGTVIEVNVSELGMVTTGGKVVFGKYAQITNNPENDGCINSVLRKYILLHPGYVCANHSLLSRLILARQLSTAWVVVDSPSFCIASHLLLCVIIAMLSLYD